MLELMSHAWWVLVLRGVLAIAFGILAFAWPGVTLELLLLLFGAYALIDGVFMAAAALGGQRQGNHWGLMLMQGVLGIVVGMLTAAAPGLTLAAILLCIAVWALAVGVLELVAALRLHPELRGELWLGLGGVLSVAFGLVVLASPLAAMLGMVWLLGGYAIAFGASLVALGARLRRVAPPEDRLFADPVGAR